MKKIAWFIPRVTKGSGGHRTIIQHVNLLNNNGYKCDIYVKDDVEDSSEDIKKQINEYYMKCNSDVYKGWNTTKKYDIAFATSWDTVLPVKKLKVKEKFYFVQDFEPWFFSMSDNYLLAESTYSEKFKTITIGKWLSYKLNKEFNAECSYFSFCADLDTYKKENIKKENAICAIFQPSKGRRCANLLISALKIVNELNPNIKIYLYGSEKQKIDGLNITHLGIVSPKKLNELYNKCKIGISMSSSNPSRIPFEMMASGLPVIELYRENNLYDLPDDCTILSESTPESLAGSILELFDDENKRIKMSNMALKFMKKYPLEKGYEEFLTSFNDLLNNKISKNKIEKIYKKEKYKKEKISNNYKYEIIFSEDSNIKKILDDNKKLSDLYSETVDLYNKTNEELNKILNSKRWKLSGLLFKPIDILKGKKVVNK